ncbi:sigma factor binding protein 1, chloroplastic-like [Zingiber officinale]|uniref:sigma factor binding protein 1, chloroplastic-like n=1 Tax=Zingiber officinale TaxID=94328 RepID=UPI001C4BFF14|nr:sigma factor binding protein 1, chloroplastic-like [Zingiber officinale]
MFIIIQQIYFILNSKSPPPRPLPPLPGWASATLSYTMKAKIMKNRRGIKVVYISNPMRVTTSAASFRALVQQLTGPDSTVAADMANLSSSFVDDNGAVHDRLPPPLPESESQSVVGQPMLLSDQLWSGTAPKPEVEEETPWEVSYESLSRWILDN